MALEKMIQFYEKWGEDRNPFCQNESGKEILQIYADVKEIMARSSYHLPLDYYSPSFDMELWDEQWFEKERDAVHDKILAHFSVRREELGSMPDGLSFLGKLSLLKLGIDPGTVPTPHYSQDGEEEMIRALVLYPQM